MMKPSRPTGVSILAILDIIGGILLLLGGAAIAAVSGSGLLSSLGYGIFAAFGVGIGGVVAVFGILAVVLGWGMWTGKGWAWLLAVVLYAIDVLFALVSLVGGAFTSIVSLAIAAIILWYMFRPHVKLFFGRGQSATPSAAPATAPSHPATA